MICFSGGVGSIPKHLAKRIAQLLECSTDAGASSKSNPALAMVPEESDEEEN